MSTAPRPAQADRGLQQLVLGVFIASGAAGLMYQVVWSRELVLLFGNTSQAISTIVTAFLAGLGGGALVGARIASRTRNPLRLYGLIEIGVAVLAVGLPTLFPVLSGVYGSAYTSVSPEQLGLIRFVLAFAAVTPATFLMGMTLPALTSFFVRSMDDAGRRLGELYAANTLGAVLGTIIAGYALIELIGLSRTALVAVGLNLLAGTVALVASLHTAPSAAEPPAIAAPARSGGQVSRVRGLVYTATFVSGFAALAFEVLWTRMLAEGSGSSIYLFAAILAIYLFGIAVGSVLFARRSSPDKDSLAALGVCLGVIGLAAGATVVLASGPLGDGYYSVRPLVLLPATVAMGYAFPLAVRIVTTTAAGAANSVGRLYASNTAGSILGSFAAAFVLASTVGTNTSILLLATIELGFGAALVLVSRPRPRRSPAFAGAFATLALIAILAPTTGLGISRTATENRLSSQGVLVAHHEDNIATVDVEGGPPAEKRLYVTGVAMTFLTVSTKLMAYLSKALRPNANSMLDICFGMGSTYRSSLILDLRTDAVELSPTVPSQMGAFFSDADRFQHDPQGRIIIADGRNYVRLATARYDVIVVDPPPPLESAGTVVLYTSEFYSEARQRLNPGGIFMMWFPYLATVDEFKFHLRTFRSVFPHVDVVLSPAKNGAYFFGSDSPMQFDPATLSGLLGTPTAASDFATAPDDPNLDGAGWAREIAADDWLHDGAVDGFVGPGPVITDDRPISEYFLLRVLMAKDHADINDERLRKLTPPAPSG
ncbi:MAG TPA: fused MFS/spermidine synthase [Candidatus Dormibacteraeota bacterium]|nr:fused MFS/spermidine synthase [Candidatus Dormibacteraeota bacterium]